MDALISAEQTWAVWSALLLAAAVGLWAERTRWGGNLSGAVVSLLVAFGLSNAGIIPADAPAYQQVWTWLVPLAIPLLLLRADLRKILAECGPLLLAFGIGAVGTVIGSVVAFYLVPLGESGWQLAAIFSATYIGGSVNYMSVAEAVGLRSGDLLAAGVAADNLMMTVYFLILFTLPSMAWLARRYPAPRTTRIEQARLPRREGVGRGPDAARLATALALAAAIAAVGYAVEQRLAWPGTGILVLTAITILIATALPRRMEQLHGASRLGMLLMQLFFAAIGASAHLGAVLKVGPGLFLFAGVILTFHLAAILIGGRLARLSLPEIVIAANANMGGPTTAAAMAAARQIGRAHV